MERINRTDARNIFETIRPELESGWKTHMICGSYRRGRENVKDLDVLVIGDYDATLQKVQAAGLEVVVGAKDAKKKHLLRFMKDGLLIDLMFVDEACWGAAAMHHTGPVELNISQRIIAKRKRLSLNQFGLWKGEVRLAGATEEGIYLALGQKYLEPKEREEYTVKGVQV